MCFQVMADSVGLPCRLVRGSSYCGKEDDAMVVIKCGDERFASTFVFLNPRDVAYAMRT